MLASLQFLMFWIVIPYGFGTDLSGMPIAPFPGLGDLTQGHSWLDHLPFRLLQKVLCGAAFGDHPESSSGLEWGSIPLLCEMHWLTIYFRVQFKVLSLLKPYIGIVQVFCRSAFQQGRGIKLLAHKLDASHIGHTHSRSTKEKNVAKSHVNTASLTPVP